MDIKKYELFADIAETESFTKTGERMGYTQSGISHTMKSLEKELGFDLFIRSKHGATLTRNARQILPDVRALLDAYRKLEQSVGSINGLESGNLVIAVFPSISIHWLPKILQRYQEYYPGIVVSLLDGGSDDVVSWVENNQADFALMSGRNIHSLEWIPLRKDPLMAVLPGSESAPADGTVPLTYFQGRPFIISTDGTEYDVHETLRTHGITPNIQFDSMEDRAIISMVRSGLGCSILPQLVIQDAGPAVQAYPLTPHCFRELGVAVKSKKQISSAARKFIRLTQTMIDHL